MGTLARAPVTGNCLGELANPSTGDPETGEPEIGDPETGDGTPEIAPLPPFKGGPFMPPNTGAGG